jgi:membrane fusion protein, heavy metal efflux system
MKLLLTLATVSLVALGCAKREEKAQGTVPQARGEASPEEGGHQGERPGTGAEDDVLRIEPSMLRDLRITTAVVERRPGTESAPVVGELRVAENAYAEVASPMSARAVGVAATAGQHVKRGQVLAELQSAELGKARGEHREAVARLDLARKALERKRGLAAERIAPVREVQEAEADLRSAEARLAAAAASLQAMGASPGGDGGGLRLTAPLSGTVIERNLAQGQVTESGQTLFRIGDLSRLWLVAHAPERDAMRVPHGSMARVVVPALPGQTMGARVMLVGSQVETGSRTIPVRLEVPNPNGVLRPGMSATVWLTVGEGASVIAVPAAALQRLEEKWCVFVPKGEGAFEKRVVGRGRDLGGEVEILSGLDAGETVVVEGSFLLKAEAEKAHGEGGHHDHH